MLRPQEQVDPEWIETVIHTSARHILVPTQSSADPGLTADAQILIVARVGLRNGLAWRGPRVMQVPLALRPDVYARLPVPTDAELVWIARLTIPDDTPTSTAVRSSGGMPSGARQGGTPGPMDDAELVAIERRLAAASPGPWRSFVEGRDHWGGDDFIQISDDDAEPDMYVRRHGPGPDLRPASTADQDFIAAARQDVPRLLAEVRRLRAHEHQGGS